MAAKGDVYVDGRKPIQNVRIEDDKVWVNGKRIRNRKHHILEKIDNHVEKKYRKVPNEVYVDGRKQIQDVHIGDDGVWVNGVRQDPIRANGKGNYYHI